MSIPDFAEEGRDLAQGLRADGAEVVIALTHMRWPNDRRLAREVDEIDIVLGMKPETRLPSRFCIKF